MRMTIFSPKAVGSEETRSSISRPSRSVLMRPSCGRRFSEMSMRESIFTRLTSGACTPAGSVWTECSTPSMRRRTSEVSRRGSMWMSEARFSNAERSRKSTACTTGLSEASSSCWLESRTSCSKFATAGPVCA